MYFTMERRSGAEIQACDILSTNTVIDNIMYCDKFRKKEDLIDAIRLTYDRIQLLGNQEREEFNNWVRYILLFICSDKERVMEEILTKRDNRFYKRHKARHEHGGCQSHCGNR